MKIGITGNNGFVGRHLTNYLKLQNKIEIVHFDKTFFEDMNKLFNFVSQCDSIVHLAAINRHEDQEILYNTNINLVMKLIEACEKSDSKPKILYSSSTQEDLDNVYGKSKKEGSRLLEKWSSDSGATVINMVIPNVFGPFGKPMYNSVVATFCHLIARGESPAIINDSDVKLIYVNELVEEILKLALSKDIKGSVNVSHRHEIKVSELLGKLLCFKKIYMEEKSFPNIDNETDLALFNTFRCYIPSDFYPVKYENNLDNRGNFVEIAKTYSSGQFSFSTTAPGITRGNHFHTRKAERFAVIKGKASVQLRKVDSDKIIEYILNGDEPAYVDMPIWFTHNITNIGEGELFTLFWINEPYNSEDPDTYFINV